MAKNKLDILPFDMDAHKDCVVDLCAKTFPSRDGYFAGLRRYAARMRTKEDFFDPATSRVGLLNGEVVTFAGVWDFQMRVGEARLRVAEIGFVVTHGEYRGRKLMQQTFRACLDAIVEAGYDMALLFGIPDFYGQFGFTRAWAFTEWTIRARHIPRLNKLPATAPFKKENWVERDCLYNRENACLTGTAVRPTRLEPAFRNVIDTLCWKNPTGKMEGYLMTARDGERLRVVELAGEPDILLGLLAQACVKQGHSSVLFESLHYQSPLCARLRQCHSREEVTYHQDGGPMSRVISLDSTLRNLEPELNHRLRRTGWKGRAQTLTLEHEGKRVDLCLARGGVKVREQGRGEKPLRLGPAIGQLLLGTEDPRALIEQFANQTEPATRDILSLLFPLQKPSLAVLDQV